MDTSRLGPHRAIQRGRAAAVPPNFLTAPAVAAARIIGGREAGSGLGVLATLVAVSTIARALAGLRVPTPWIAADEMVYAELGRSLWETGRLDILGQDAAFYSLVHPALIGLPLAVFDTALGYDVARVVESLAMSLAAVPVFAWGRPDVGALGARGRRARPLHPRARVHGAADERDGLLPARRARRLARGPNPHGTDVAQSGAARRRRPCS